MMMFNKLQGFTLVLSFSLVFLLNVKPFDSAEAIVELVQDVIGNEMSDLVLESIESAVDAETVTSAAIDALGDSIDDIKLSTIDGEEIQSKIEEQVQVEAETQEIQKITEKFIKSSPKLKALANPKIIGAIVAVVIAVAVMVKLYMSRKPKDWIKDMTVAVEKAMARPIDPKLSATDQATVKKNKNIIHKKLTDLVKASDTAAFQAKAKEFAEKVKKAESELGVKSPKIWVNLNGMAAGKRIVLDSATDEIRELREVINKGLHKNITDEHKELLDSYRDEFYILCSDYENSFESRKKAELWLKVLNLSDQKLVKIYIMAEPHEILENA